VPDNASNPATVKTAPVYRATITTTSGILNPEAELDSTPYGVWGRRLNELSSIAETAFKNRSDSYEKLAAEKILRDQNATYLGLLRGENAKNPGSVDTFKIEFAESALSGNNFNIYSSNRNIALQNQIIEVTEAKKLEADRDEAKKRSPWIGYASTAYQLSIVLLSASILAVSMPMFWASFVVAAVGGLLSSQGLLLWI
jgi:hypothetical protein